jgi:hypothetical protein
MLCDDDRFAAFSDLRSWSSFESYMPDHLTRQVARNHRNELATYDLGPVAERRKYLRMHIVMAIHLYKTAGDASGVGLLRRLNYVITD